MNISYLALLRGINVGGNNMVPMAELREALSAAGLINVRTYIQSGNILFESSEKNTQKLTSLIESTIQKRFKITAATVVFSKAQWQAIISKAPKKWGADAARKHNLLVLLPPYNMQEVVAAIGTLKPDIEELIPGDGVLYQSMSLALMGRTTTSTLASNPIYKRMTVRNYNTSVKLLDLL